METKKTNEQLHQELEDALKNLSEKLYNLLHYGSYQFDYLDRGFKSDKLSSGVMRVGNHKLLLKSTEYKYGEEGGTEVIVSLPGNPVNEEMLKAWDRQVIDRDIEYYQKKLDGLLEWKKELTGMV